MATWAMGLGSCASCLASKWLWSGELCQSGELAFRAHDVEAQLSGGGRLTD